MAKTLNFNLMKSTRPQHQPLTAADLQPHITGLGYDYDKFVMSVELGFMRPTEIQRALRLPSGQKPGYQAAKKWVKLYKEGQKVIDDLGKLRRAINTGGKYGE